MLSGAVLVLFGEALMLLSRPHFEWALICRDVLRLLPHWRPWDEAGP